MSDQEPRVYNGRYELHRRIARGGMAEVFLARDQLLDRPVALKVLFPEFATDPAFVARFRREAQAAANLSHPNIVSVYDWGEEDSTYFIVMEYVEGRSLAQIVRDEGPLLPDRAAEVATDIAAALGFAHRNGVIHRDVKPGNVLISPLGQVKVTDFGIARAVSTQENLTQTGTVMGTATYFSPEQARGEQVDPRSDVYSLGIVLYELLVGEPPFTGDNPVSVAYKHVQEQAELPTRRNPRVPAPLEAVAMKALAKNPANRYASAEEMAADLRRYRDGRPVVAEAILPADDLTVAAGATAMASAADTTRAVTPADGGTRAIPVPDAAYARHEEPPHRSAMFLLVLGILLIALIGGLVVLANNLGLGESSTMVEVPGVVDLPEAQARAQLESLGFEVAAEQDTDTDRDPGIVLRQRPVGGSRFERGDTVTIVVNAAQAAVEVPNVVGRTEGEADSILRQAGLVADIETVVDESRPEGEVIDQDPEPGVERPRGSVVRITVSRGPGVETVPDVTRLDEETATARLERSGFVVEVAEETSEDVREGLVIRSEPPAGTELERGATVTIFVSSGPPSTTTTTTTLFPTSSSSTTTTSSTSTSTTTTTEP